MLSCILLYQKLFQPEIIDVQIINTCRVLYVAGLVFFSFFNGIDCLSGSAFSCFEGYTHSERAKVDFDEILDLTADAFFL